MFVYGCIYTLKRERERERDRERKKDWDKKERMKCLCHAVVSTTENLQSLISNSAIRNIIVWAFSLSIQNSFISNLTYL